MKWWQVAALAILLAFVVLVGQHPVALELSEALANPTGAA